MTAFLWFSFIGVLLVILLGVLYLFDRVPRVVSFRVSLAWTGFWMALALAFSILIHYVYEHHIWGFGVEPGFPASGPQAMSAFLAAYFIETCLNFDNVFGAAVIFSHFGVRLRVQYRVLYWGVLAALVVRGLMIGICAQLYAWFPWFNYVLGAVLVLCALRLVIVRHERLHPDRNLMVLLARRCFPVAANTDGGKFFTRVAGKWVITPLFIALLLIETSDTVFAFDSIPASFAVTRDPFLVFTANVFAILGMRSLYFALLGFIDRFYYLRASLVALLLFMALRMFLEDVVYFPVPVIIAGAALIMSCGVAASMRSEKRAPEPLAGAYTEELEEYARMTLRQARKVIVLMVGSTVILIGAAMILLPGPAMVVIPTGLAILATEFVWARRMLNRLKQEATGMISYVRHFRRTAPPLADQAEAGEEKARTGERPTEK